MSSAKVISDRPFLRLFAPDSAEAVDVWTVQIAFDRYRKPELENASAGHRSDAKRRVKLWYEFEVDLEQSLAASQPEEPESQDLRIEQAHRINYPMRLSDISSKHLQAFALWLAERGYSGSEINKAVGEIHATIDRAAAQGVEVQTIRTRRVATSARPRYYFNDEGMRRLWEATRTLDWPPRRTAARKGSTFVGSGVLPEVFWRAVLVLLRNYGMRVQDLIAYASGKRPVTWSQITFDERSPNPDSLEVWPLGWLWYEASKNRHRQSRRFYLPLTVSARGAIDRLHAGAYALGGGHVDPGAPVFVCPRSHSLTEQFVQLQQQAEVETRDGRPYQLEDFRKTVATFAAQADRGLPNALCGWGGGGIKERHYLHPEPLLVDKLHMAPLPSCFGEWCDPEHTARVNAFLDARMSGD